MVDLNSLSIDELKKIRLKETTTKLIARSKNPLDKITSIDDLLRESIIAQRDLTDITHRLLLAIALKDGTGASIQPNGVDTSAILGLKGGGNDDYQTKVEDVGGTKITGSGKVFELEGSGILAECRFQTSNSTINNKNYGVKIFSDNNIIYQDTWANFFTRSFHETDMSCWEDVPNSCYILVFQKIAFVKKLIIEIYGSSAIFTNIYLKYHQRVVS